MRVRETCGATASLNDSCAIIPAVALMINLNLV